MKPYSLILAGAGVLAACGTTTVLCPAAAQEETANTSRDALIAALNDRFDDPDFQRAFWGARIESLDDGDLWYDRNGEKLFIPASNEKIPTSAAALRALGADYTFETTLALRGEVEDGTLDGDLVIFGTGDPTLYKTHFRDPLPIMADWAKALKEKGITRISGTLIGDDDAFADQHTHWSWPHSAYALSQWYNAEFGALQINENYIDLEIVPPQEAGGQVEIIPNLRSAYYTIIPDITVVEDGNNRVSGTRDFDSNTIRVSGTVVAGSSSFEISPTISNPTMYFLTVLHEQLQANGIEVEGEPLDCDEIPGWDHEPEDFDVLLVHESPPLLEILTKLMQRSQNMYAETMVMAMGYEAQGLGSYDNGSEVVEEQLSAMGVPDGSYVFRDGSGLSRYNYVSPEMINTINRWMYESDLKDQWLSVFPVAGESGTLRRRMIGTPAESNVRAKTGTISNVRALSGYVTTASGEELLFSFLVNGHTASGSDTNRVTDGVLALLAEYEGE